MKLARGFLGFILGAVLSGGFIFLLGYVAKWLLWLADHYGPVGATAVVFAVIGGFILGVACYEDAFTK